MNQELNLSSRYGSIDVKLIDKGFSVINLNTGYTDIDLEFDEKSSYSIDIRHLNSYLVLPSQNVKSEKKTINEEKKEYMTFGTVGQNPGSAKVKIDANRGHIYLK